MVKQFDGGSAFPAHLVNNQGRIDSSRDYGEEGLSMRDYFAAKAMQGFLHTQDYTISCIDILAEHSYRLADAMLKERAR